MTASQVIAVEIVPAKDKPPVEKTAPMSGVISVVPQVGQPAPSAISPVIIPAFSTFAELGEFRFFFFCQRKTMRPIKILCSIARQKIGSQSRNGWLMPRIASRFSPIILRLSGKPSILMSSNFESPPDSIFIKKLKIIKLGMKPYQKRFRLVARKMPLPAKIKPSSHFLQFIMVIIAQVLSWILNREGVVGFLFGFVEVLTW